MVGKMHSQGSNNLPADTDLPDFPVFDRPMVEPWPMAMSWSDAVRQMAPLRDHYMQHHDSPEKRFADKNPEPFILD